MKRLYLLLILLSIFLSSKADEGMWLINLLTKMNIADMHQQGLMLSAEQIYSINKSSLKDAIVAIDHGNCTGEIISSEGLMLTNYHCAYGEIQNISTLEHSYLKNGFWSRKKSEEIAIKGKTASFLVKVEDVSKEIKQKIAEEKSKGNNNRLMMRRIFVDIEKKMGGNLPYSLVLKKMTFGEKYYMFYYQTYKDIRLVGVPPESIGNFGGNIDNWMWPQHKCDFALYRIYATKEGKPANYSKDNVPFIPKYVIPISTRGVKEGDFTMLLGYPGKTNRYLSSYDVLSKTKITNKAIIDVRAAKLCFLKKQINLNENIRLKYSIKFFDCSNKYKSLIGENKYTKQYGVVARKLEQESLMKDWINAKKSRKYQYNSLFTDTKNCLDKINKYIATEVYHKEVFLRGIDMLSFSMHLKALRTYLLKDNGKLKDICYSLKCSAKEYYKNYDMEIDKHLFELLLKKYVDNSIEEGKSKDLKSLLKRFKKNYQRLANYIYKKSFLRSEKDFNKFIENPSVKLIDRDLAYVISSSVMDKIYKIRTVRNKLEREHRSLKDLYLEVLTQMGSKQLYPDANSTMRLTYGNIGSYSPKDAVQYSYRTSVKAYLEKESNEAIEFKLLARTKQLIKSKDFGRYAENGKLYTCFITNTDITGGNSGSPVLNSKGELIGLAYDGNWESMAGSLYFHPKYNKTVCVDIRFMLWIIDKYAEGNNIMKEINCY